MKAYPNFYENLREANDRLTKTVVLYDGEPFHVLAITDHKEDGIFRVWLAPQGLPKGCREDLIHQSFFTIINGYGSDHPGLGKRLDTEFEKNPDCGVLRKHMNSPKFNRFRPFPLGMCNVGVRCFYVERQPVRPLMHQGLVRQALFETLITAGARRDNPARIPEKVDIYSPEFRDCILGDHNDAQTVLDALNNPEVTNDAHAFHREFALVRGPLGSIYLAYKTDVIGLLPNNDLSHVLIGREFGHCLEEVNELGIFERVSRRV